MSDNLLITGSAGFIGINFLNYLVSMRNKPYRNVVCVDKMGYATTYNKDVYLNLCEIGKIGHLNMDLSVESDKPILPEKNWDILDFASESHVDNSIKDPNAIFNENVKIPAGVISLIGLESIDRYIHISTDEVYGEIDIEDAHNFDNWFSPFTNIKPNNPYSASKVAQDCYLMAMKHTFGLNVKFIRLANQFGPFQHPEKMLPASVLRVVNGESIKVYGEGKNIRQWTPVVDSVKIIYDALLGKLDGCFMNNVLHIAKYEINENTGQQILYDNNSVVDIWKVLLEKKISEIGWLLAVSKQYIEDRKGHDTAYALKTHDDIQKYFNTSLEQRFKETIDFYVDSRKLYGVE